ncbi:MAG: DUF4834 domain-containing protein [Bacteroidota bacterium]
MKLLLFILSFVVVYYLLSKYIFPYLLRYFIRKTQERFGQFQNQQKPEDRRKEGEVKVDYVPPESKKSKFNPESTEDVDYEEIKE